MSIYEKLNALLDRDSEPEEEETSPSLPQKSEVPFYKSPLVWLTGIGSILILKTLFGGEKRYTIRGAMYLSKNFRVGEFLRSDSIPELETYQLTQAQLLNLKRLAGVMQIIRDDIGAPISITSGGRPPDLKASGGKYAGKSFVEILKAKHYKPAEFSQHMDFSACDFTTKDKRWLIDIMKSMTNIYFYNSLGKTITQVILYIEDGVPDFIHFGVHSDINDFMGITAGKRLLLAQVTTTKDANGKTIKRDIKWHQYTVQKLEELLKK